MFFCCPLLSVADSMVVVADTRAVNERKNTDTKLMPKIYNSVDNVFLSMYFNEFVVALILVAGRRNKKKKTKN